MNEVQSHLLKIVRHLLQQTKVTICPADIYVKMPELSIEEVLSIIGYPHTEPIDEDEPWNAEARAYADVLLYSLQEFMRKEVARLLI